MDEVSLLDVFLGKFDNAPEEKQLESTDSFYKIVAGSFHRLFCGVHGEAL